MAVPPPQTAKARYSVHAHHVATSAFPDTSWYLDVVGWAAHTPWLHEAAKIYTIGGFVVLVLLFAVGALRARHFHAGRAASVLAAPIAVLCAYGVNELVKTLVREVRPCDTLHITTTVVPCDPVTDFSFPSNHTAVAVAIAVALLLVHRVLGWIAVFFALLMGASRVYVGAHYPHDVLAGIVVGAVVVLVVGLLGRQLLAGPVTRMRSGSARWLLGPGVPASSYGREEAHELFR